jgi:hypothetical protein
VANHFYGSSPWLAIITRTCNSYKRRSFVLKSHRLKARQARANRMLLCFLFSPFFPSRSRTPLQPSNTLHMVRLWRSVAIIFVSTLFCSFFCSQLRRARIKAPQGITTSTPLMSSIARRRQTLNSLPHRDPASNRKKNQTSLQPQKRRI